MPFSVRHRSGQVVSSQDRGSAGSVTPQAVLNASATSRFCSKVTVSGSTDTNMGVPLSASSPSHSRFSSQSMCCSVIGGTETRP